MLEDTAKEITLAEPLAAGTREYRVIWDVVLNVQASEPAIGEVHLHLTAQQPLRADGKNIVNDEHSDHEFRINRRAAERRVVRRQLRAHPGQLQHSRDLADAVIVRNDVIKAERVKKLALVSVEPTHHRSPPQRIVSRRRNHCSHTPANDFCNKIGQNRTRAMQQTACHSITSSARLSRLSDTSSPRAFAVLRLIASRYSVVACTGRLFGFSPLRMRSTYPAASR